MNRYEHGYDPDNEVIMKWLSHMYFTVTSRFTWGMRGFHGNLQSYEQFMSTLTASYHEGNFLPNGFDRHNTHNMSYVY